MSLEEPFLASLSFSKFNDDEWDLDLDIWVKHFFI